MRAYRRLKELRKGPMSKNGLKKIIRKFEKPGDLDVLAGSGRKPVANETVEEIAYCYR